MRCVERPLKSQIPRRYRLHCPLVPYLGYCPWTLLGTYKFAKFLLSNLLSKHLTRTQSTSVCAFSSSYPEYIWKTEKTSETAVEYNLLNTELLSAVFG